MEVNSSWIFAYGCAGALAPEIIRLYKMRLDRPTPVSWLFYIVISVVFGLLGGFVAVILPTVTPWGAFYAGVACPITISAALGKSGKPPKEPPSRRYEKDERLEASKTPTKDRAARMAISLPELDIRSYFGRLFY